MTQLDITSPINPFVSVGIDQSPAAPLKEFEFYTPDLRYASVSPGSSLYSPALSNISSPSLDSSRTLVSLSPHKSKSPIFTEGLSEISMVELSSSRIEIIRKIAYGLFQDMQRQNIAESGFISADGEVWHLALPQDKLQARILVFTQRLGSGGFGNVYAATEITLGVKEVRQVAVKLAKTAKGAKEIEQEFAVLKALWDPNGYPLDETRSLPPLKQGDGVQRAPERGLHFANRLAAGSLSEYEERDIQSHTMITGYVTPLYQTNLHHALVEGLLTDQEILSGMHQLLNALCALKARFLCHGDIKELNVLLTKGETLEIGLADFSGAIDLRYVDDEWISPGTPQYINDKDKELFYAFTAKGETNTAAFIQYQRDLYAVGLIFESCRNYGSRVLQKNKELKQLVSDMVNKDPMKRIVAEEALTRLEAIMAPPPKTSSSALSKIATLFSRKTASP